MGFVTRVAMAAEVLDHHPDLRIVYNTVDIVLSSHDAGGVTDRDFALAKKIDEYA
jgi:4a-hydroxytetrahydrobiopterin dehydratase